jgi:hypothetical protein
MSKEQKSTHWSAYILLGLLVWYVWCAYQAGEVERFFRWIGLL